MLKSKTHFEQVPLEAVREIVDEQIRGVTITGLEEETRERTVEGNLLGRPKTIVSEGAIRSIDQTRKSGQWGAGLSRNGKTQQGRNPFDKKFRIVLRG
ncbi:MAG: hypothetical protein WB780_21675 [Candidatus Acidiferrales bacterium]